MDNENELQGSPKPDESGLVEQPLEELAPQDEQPAEEADALKEQLAKVKERNQVLFNRAKQAEDTKKKQREELEKLRPKKEEPKAQPTLDAREYARLLHQGYSEEEIDFVEKQVKVLGKPASDVLKDAFTLSAIRGVREKKKAEQATPSPSARSPQKQGEKTKHLTPDEWRAQRTKRN